MPAPFPATNNWAFRLGDASASIHAEFFLDLACPFASKLFKVIARDVVPHTNDLQVSILHYSQPWHWQSSILNSIGVAIRQTHPKLYVQSLLCIIENRESFCAVDTADLPVNVYIKNIVSRIVNSGVELDSAKVLNALTPGSTENKDVIQEIKFQTRFGRQNSIHATPTVIINGLTEPSIDSSFSAEQWLAHIDYLKGQTIPLRSSL